MLQSKAGYIDARPLTASSTKPLATHDRTIHSGQSLPKWDVCATSAFPLLATEERTLRNVSNVPTGDSSTAVSVIVAGLTSQGRNWPRHGKKQTTRKYEE